MHTSIRRILRGGVITGVVATVSMASVIWGGSAGAQITGTPGNNIIIGSGSNTAYPLMWSLDLLFDKAPGCNLIAATGTTQPLDFSCPTGAAGLAAPYGENPTNDVALQEPALGGKYGLSQLEDQGSGVTTETAQVDFATGVRTPLATDPTGLNFVTYARDAISWLHWTEVNGKKTASATVKNLSNSQLAEIWDGSITNWDKVGGTNAPIDVYVTNSGSGLLSLWNNYLGGSTYNAQSYVLSKGSKYADTHIIEQNEDASIIANGDEKDAIFFFSYGRYQESCAVVCGGTKVPGKGPTHNKLGEINDDPLSAANILSGAWPDLVYLTNIYSNGTNAAIPAANQATLNYVSEDGFLCKPNIDPATKSATIDPNTGVSYRSEINSLITAAGDVPLPRGKEGTVDAPAVLSAPYKAYDSSGTDPTGYCRVTTTDSA
ncbi:MAG: substrate-binding domain-containing protein [Acidimicrobiales bacterium]